jgi:hypothetical protein
VPYRHIYCSGAPSLLSSATPAQERSTPAQELYTPAQEVQAADTPGTNNGSLLQEYQLPDGIQTADYVATLVTSSFTRLGGG